MVAVVPAAVWFWFAGRRGGDRTDPGGDGPTAPATDSDGGGLPTPSMIAVVVVVLVAVGFGLLSMFTRRPDSDDSYLVNRALYAEEHADTFATRDAMFSDEVFESVRPDVAPSSIEPLVGVLGRLSGIEVQTLTFLVLGPVVAAVGIFAAWRLVRTMRVRACPGARHRGYGGLPRPGRCQASVLRQLQLRPGVAGEGGARPRSGAVAVALRDHLEPRSVVDRRHRTRRRRRGGRGFLVNRPRGGAGDRRPRCPGR